MWYEIQVSLEPPFFVDFGRSAMRANAVKEDESIFIVEMFLICIRYNYKSSFFAKNAISQPYSRLILLFLLFSMFFELVDHFEFYLLSKVSIDHRNLLESNTKNKETRANDRQIDVRAKSDERMIYRMIY